MRFTLELLGEIFRGQRETLRRQRVGRHLAVALVDLREQLPVQLPHVVLRKVWKHAFERIRRVATGDKIDAVCFLFDDLRDELFALRLGSERRPPSRGMFVVDVRRLLLRVLGERMVVCERRRTLDLALLIVHAIDVFLDHRELRAQSGSVGVLFLGALLDARRFEHSLRSLSPRFTHAREATDLARCFFGGILGVQWFRFHRFCRVDVVILRFDFRLDFGLRRAVQNKAENCHQITKRELVDGTGNEGFIELHHHALSLRFLRFTTTLAVGDLQTDSLKPPPDEHLRHRTLHEHLHGSLVLTRGGSPAVRFPSRAREESTVSFAAHRRAHVFWLFAMTSEHVSAREVHARKAVAHDWDLQRNGVFEDRQRRLRTRSAGNP